MLLADLTDKEDGDFQQWSRSGLAMSCFRGEMWYSNERFFCRIGWNKSLKKFFKGEEIVSAEFTNLVFKNDSLELCKPWIRAYRSVESI